MYPDFKELLSAFNAHRVKYMIVGGYAVSFHAQPRTTKDIDILVKCDVENSAATYAALVEFGAPMEEITPQDFIEEGSFFRIGREPVAVDLLSEIPGVNFDESWERRVEDVIDTATGIRANFISADDLISAKLASGRLQDLADVAAIRDALNISKPQRAKQPPKSKEPA